MEKAIIAALITALIGWFLADWLYQLPEIGGIIAIAVTSGFIICFSGQKKRLPVFRDVFRR